MGCVQIRVLIELSKEIFARNLKHLIGLCLETKITGSAERNSRAILRYFAHQGRKWLISNKKICIIRQFANFMQRVRSTSMCFWLPTATFESFFPRSFVSELFVRLLSASRFNLVCLVRAIVVMLEPITVMIVQKKNFDFVINESTTSMTSGTPLNFNWTNADFH